jgi:hypothetical protein
MHRIFRSVGDRAVKNGIYTAITYLAMVATPIAVAINFGAAAYDMLLPRGAYLALLGGVSAGIGMETVGMIAGYLSMRRHNERDRRWLLAAAVLLAYVAIGMYELAAVPVARFLPLLAALVYVLAGLHQDTVATAQQTQAAQVDERQWERQRQAEADAHRRELERLEAEQRHAEKLARIEVKARTQPDKQPDKADKADMSADVLTDRQTDILDMLRQGMSQADIAVSVGVSERTVRRDIVAMNGHASAKG